MGLCVVVLKAVVGTACPPAGAALDLGEAVFHACTGNLPMAAVCTASAAVSLLPGGAVANAGKAGVVGAGLKVSISKGVAEVAKE